MQMQRQTFGVNGPYTLFSIENAMLIILQVEPWSHVAHLNLSVKI